MSESSKQPTLLKDYYSTELVKSIAKNCKAQDNYFKIASFEKKVLGKDWEQLELKERMHRIADMLGEHLPKAYKRSISILLKVAVNYSGLAHMCFPDFVEKFGLDDFETSMMALEKLTEGSSSEFAIRPFIIRYPKLTMQKMKTWAQSDNYHVRRLATEGCRPRLPWAMALPDFKQDPSIVLETIMVLIDDDELYVRRSVANNLNDISKDNPKRVIEIASQYLGRSKDIDWVIKHACRGLLKQGNKKVLQLFGFLDVGHIKVTNFRLDESVCLEERLNFSFELKSTKESLEKLRVEFTIDFMKANGKTAGKIFKICEGDYNEKAKSIKKTYSFKKISTRKYYVGEHQLHIVINGEVFDSKKFSLV
ncbi:MAG: DNA alkylation repair protein [Gammaproteobacteria bacterium]|nr:MAG: DNA alkylation repair protein [Gammaproteobacteria bacterium]